MRNKVILNLLCVGLASTLLSQSGARPAVAQQDDAPPPPEPPPEAKIPPPAPPTPPPAGAPGMSKPAMIAPKGAAVTKVGADTAKVVIDDKKGADAVPPGQELVNMDFPEPTEIKDIIRAVALWTGKNVILDRNVSGKIQIISPKRVTKEEAYQAFLSALNVLQFTTVETGKIIKIMPIRSAIKGNLRTFQGSKWTPLTEEIITQIVPLRYVDAISISNTLSRIVSPNSMVPYDKTNTLIISDSGFKVRRILDILELIDVQGQQPQVAFVPIRYADAKTISDRVSEILKANTAAGGGSYGAFKLIVDDRSNSVIVFGPPRTIADVQDLVRKFDIEIDDPSRQSTIHVRPLDYADAKKIASTLQSLAQGNKKKAPGGFIPQIGGGMNHPPGAPGEVATAELDDNVKITADESSNSLLITGSRSAYQSVNSIIRKLDIRRSQVYVEADILDLQSDNGFNFGTSIFGGAMAGRNPVISTWQGKGLAPLVAAQAGATTAQTAQGAEKIAGSFAEDMTIGILSSQPIEIPGLGKFTPGALIKLIKTDSNTRTLATPHIMTANNEEAKITVGDRVYFRSSEINPTSGVSAPKVEKEDVDLSLTIKPNISNSNYVTMKVDIEASSVALDSATNLPKVKKRKTSQLLTVKNSQTIVISGLVKNEEQESFQKIPLLGDIPILGWLFRNSVIAHQTSNMMVFLTPHIVHGADDLAAIYQSKVKERDEYLDYVYGDSFKDDRFYALLPKAEDGVYHADPQDADEKARQESVIKSMLDDDGSSGPTASDKKALTTPLPVPMNATLGGHSGEGGGLSGGGPVGSSPGVAAPPPPPANLPPPMGGGGGGDDMPPEPPPPPEPPEMVPEG